MQQKRVEAFTSGSATYFSLRYCLPQVAKNSARSRLAFNPHSDGEVENYLKHHIDNRKRKGSGRRLGGTAGSVRGLEVE